MSKIFLSQKLALLYSNPNNFKKKKKRANQYEPIH